MTKKRGNIMGSKPAQDPMEQLETSGMTITTDTEIRWDDRSVRPPWDYALGLSLAILIVVIQLPRVTTLVTGVILMLMLVLPSIQNHLETRSLTDSVWYKVPEPDVSYSDEKKSLQCRGLGSERHLIALNMKNARSVLQGNLSKLLRGLDTSHGFLMVADLFPSDSNQVARDGVVTSIIERYLNHISSSQRKTYFHVRGGLWRSQLYFVGHSHTESDVRLIEGQVKGSVPDSGFKRLKEKDLGQRLKEWDLCKSSPTFYATGAELAKWLVQLPSELGSEVGSNVPGEFIAPIRSRSDDYPLGIVVNPETLKTGPPVGLMHSDLERGLLLCGGDWQDRKHVLSVLVGQILTKGKRVLVLTINDDGQSLAGVSPSGITLSLGKDFVLNPVDSEAIPRTQYVSELLLLLETLAGTNLSSAADFEVALSRVVALGNGTLADVIIDPEHESLQEGAAPPQNVRLSKSSVLALDAIKRLYQGSGAKAFYGTQTLPLSRITSHDLVVVNLAIGALDLDMFALDLMSLKLSGLARNSDLVTVIDMPEHLATAKSTFRYTKRGVMAERIVRGLLKRGPLVLSVNNPSALVWDAADSFGSCITLRLRESADIAYVSDLLSLDVVETGIHSKARQSSRESSFLRVMERGYALMSHEQAKTCMPFKIAPEPELRTLSNKGGDVLPRTSLARTDDESRAEKRKTLLAVVGGRDTASVKEILKLLTRYEPLTEESVRRFLNAKGHAEVDIEAILARLENASLILRGSESHAGVSYKNYRITMKGSMALRQSEEVEYEV